MNGKKNREKNLTGFLNHPLPEQLKFLHSKIGFQGHIVLKMPEKLQIFDEGWIDALYETEVDGAATESKLTLE